MSEVTANDGMIGERVDETRWPEKPGPGDNYWCCGECHPWKCDHCGGYHCNWFDAECPRQRRVRATR